MLITGKDRPSAFVAHLADADAHIHQLRRKLWIAGGVGVLVMLFATLLIAVGLEGDDAYGSFCGCSSVGGVFGGIMLWGSRAKVAAAERKVKFAVEMFEAFRDDYHPALKVRHHLDLRHYDTADKKYWEGRSAHGNKKFRYNDRWFRQKFFLADGTKVLVERRGDLKIRKGSVMRHKRRVYVTVEPSVTTFGPGPFTGRDDLQQMVGEVMKGSFHDPPEFMSVRRDGDQAHIQLKVTQLDAPILGKEVLALVEGVLLFLQMQR